MQSVLPDDRTRCQMDLEFALMLTNPAYLNYIVQSEVFKTCEFRNYLEYLQYLLKPPYSQLLVYPTAHEVLQLVSALSRSESTLPQNIVLDIMMGQVMGGWSTRSEVD